MVQTQGRPPKYTGMIQSFNLIFKEEGLRGFFRGNGVNVARIFPSSAIQFYAYESYKKMLLQTRFCEGKDELTPSQRFLAGGAAGITSLSIVYPLEFARARLTVQTSESYFLSNFTNCFFQTEKYYRGVGDCLSKVIKKEGVTGIYRGLYPSILGVLPYVGLDFAVYETLKSFIIKKYNGEVSNLATLACGGVAGVKEAFSFFF